MIQHAHRRRLFRNVIKVRSHEDEAAYPEAVEKWAIQGNQCADEAAEFAREQLNPALLLTRDRLCRRVQKQITMRDAMRKLLVEIGFKSVASKEDLQTFDDQKWTEKLAQPRDFDEAQLSLVPMPSSLSISRHHSLGDHAQVVFDWLCKLVKGGSGVPMWLSSHQLLVHFQIFMQKRGFKFNQRTNRWDEDIPRVGEPYEFHKGANAFQAIVKCLAGVIGIPFKPQQRLPAGNIYRCWINCLLVPVAAHEIHHINDLLSERGATTSKRSRRS